VRIDIKSLGLAAYIKQHGVELISCQKNNFVFESSKDAEYWEIKYANSCCSKHDGEVCNLRRLTHVKRG